MADVSMIRKLRSTPLYEGGGEASSLGEDAAYQLERLTAERDALRAAIVRHRERVWGFGPVGHDEDEALYAVLAGGSEPGVINERDAEHG